MNDNSKASPELLKAFQDIDNYAAAELARREQAEVTDADRAFAIAQGEAECREQAQHTPGYVTPDGTPLFSAATMNDTITELAAENERLRGLLAATTRYCNLYRNSTSSMDIEEAHDAMLAAAIEAAKEDVK